MEQSLPQNENSNSFFSFEDLKSLFLLFLRKWYWFAAVAVICAAIGFVYSYTKQPKFSSETTMLLRTDYSSNLYSQMTIVEGVGFTNSSRYKEDEIVILKSNFLRKKVIQDLGIETEYYAKSKLKGYVELYKDSPYKLILPENFQDTTTVMLIFDLHIRDNGYDIKLHADKETYKYFIEDISTPFETPFGTMKFEEIISDKPSKIKKTKKYRILNTPADLLAQKYENSFNIKNEVKYTNILTIRLYSYTPEKALDFLNKLIEIYYLDAAEEKNMAVANALQVIDERIDAINRELSDIESRLDIYTSANKSHRDKDYLELLRLKQVKEENYRFLMNKRQENEILYVTNIPQAKTLDAPFTKRKPVSPGKKNIMMTAALIGILLSAIVIFCMDLYRRKSKK